ncbi:MAG: hypothetical protein ACI8WB_002076 [Phenylobacterium sp.]
MKANNRLTLPCLKFGIASGLTTCLVTCSVLALTGCAVPQVTRTAQTIPVIPEAEQEQRTVVKEGASVLEFYYPNRSVEEDKNDPNRISDAKLAYPAKTLPRLPVLFESGDAFLNHGPIKPGIETPAGQMLQPSFLLYGDLRTALQSFDDGVQSRSEQTNRINLHGNVHLSGTERIVFTVRPLDSATGEFTGYNFGSDSGSARSGNDDGWHESVNGTITRLFFEGEFGEIFPGLDPADSGTLDWGFSVGRQPVMLQDGILLNDEIDLVGVTRNSLINGIMPNLRMTAIYGWNEVNRSHNRRQDKSARLFALLSEADTSWDSTIALDVIYVNDDYQTDAWYLGASSIQRMGMINTAFRVNASMPDDGESAAVDGGVILSAEFSRTMHGSDNLMYLNAFWSIDHFTQAARSADAGPAVANLGLLYSPVGMGRYSVPLGGSIADTFGSTFGYQMYLDGIRSQLIVEVGARTSTSSGSDDQDAFGVAARYQRAIGLRHLLRFDAFAASVANNRTSHGLRVEWKVKF